MRLQLGCSAAAAWEGVAWEKMGGWSHARRITLRAGVLAVGKMHGVWRQGIGATRGNW